MEEGSIGMTEDEWGGMRINGGGIGMNVEGLG